MPHDAVDARIAYHDRTKHHLEGYARGPGGLDWANQPDPFRRYTGSPGVSLPLASRDDTPASGVLFSADFARTLSCHQDIAADGAFSLGMLGQFETILRERGAAA